MMTLRELDTLYRTWLPVADFEGFDSSLNGLQVGDREASVSKVAFAVDGSLASMEKAVEAGAGCLVVHHGLFWGKCLPITGYLYNRIRYLAQNNLALYALHLPLDAQPDFGNNMTLASMLGLVDIRPFGEYKRKKIGFRGTLPEPLTLKQIADRLFGEWDRDLKVFPFGPDPVSTVAVITGDAPREVEQAIDGGVDLYITGETSHEIYHACLESGINVLFGGHYRTETGGIRRLCEKTARELGLETVFIDIPTGL
jgi:dinuclear metal center YbgI/SA1388 family protein